MPGTENSDGNGSLEAIGNRIGSMLAIVALGTYIVMVATFIAFVSSVLLLALVPALPPLVVALARKDKVLALRRGKAACWALGFVILVLFPAFWLIPDQVYRRVNRQSVLITPGAPAVVAMGQEFLETHPGYSSLPFDDKARLACTFTLEKVQWKLDLEIYGLSGHVATPSECLSAEADDCQGQAVTLASLLLYLGFEHAWAVETPFHWYVLVRDPARGALPAGWELDVESLQASGEVLALNRDGGGDMPPWRFEEVMLIFNDRETLFPVDALAQAGSHARGDHCGHQRHDPVRVFRGINVRHSQQPRIAPGVARPDEMSSSPVASRRKHHPMDPRTVPRQGPGVFFFPSRFRLSPVFFSPHV